MGQLSMLIPALGALSCYRTCEEIENSEVNNMSVSGHLKSV